MKWQLIVVLVLLSAMLTIPTTGSAKAETFRLISTQERAQTQRAAPSTVRVTTDVYAGDEFVFGGLAALFHTSQNNTWLNFATRQPPGVNIIGTGRVQVINGRVQADGVVVLTLAPQAQVYIDLGQLNGAETSPFEVGPGGGCLVGLMGVQTSPQTPMGVVVPVFFEFFSLDD